MQTLKYLLFSQLNKRAVLSGKYGPQASGTVCHM